MGNLKNIAIAILVPLPSILFYLSFLHHHPSSTSSASLYSWCYNHPFLLANLLFFFNVDLLFWLVGLLQSNNWLIDLYWTVIPVMLVHYYASHPLASADAARSAVAIALTWVWSVRLTHNYLRRERWEWGAREDWRFGEMRKEYGRSWWWISFFAVFLSQQVFLIGICLPMYAIHSSNEPWNIRDFIATIICIAGIMIAYFADTQLHNFVTKSQALREVGEKPIANLDEGLWRYSRHPNYFGEQLWWWGLYLFAWNLGQKWMFVGPLVNSSCLAYVTVLVETRMLKREYRREAYRQYQRMTSVWIPWFKRADKGTKEKSI
ncbi:uncharacterized protein C594.04c [Ananas comosus]|uniref:Uncharacterized protein C594.04c n=1 Tax=Ananas comosus TaxID=4615 RepID=A0A199VC24_ANACO|nr:uncharacterized protein C594.04c [Ananas comosus]OAY74644.1 Uncharacterized protein ACMD2_02389 [Ananas comosus]